MRLNSFIFFSMLLFVIACQKLPQWTFLFDGQNLSGYTVINGSAEYIAGDSAIIGISQLNSPNSFLSSEKIYRDFILDFQVKIDSGLNSGVQFRSIQDPTIKNGIVHGYQCEIETSPRKWAGGIYDEGRRGWLYPLTSNSKGQEAFKNGEWNQYRIQAIGPNINTWVNGIHCANLVDTMTQEGIIAFQVHSISDSTLINKKVRWRNIKIITADLDGIKDEYPSIAPEIDLRQ